MLKSINFIFIFLSPSILNAIQILTLNELFLMYSTSSRLFDQQFGISFDAFIADLKLNWKRWEEKINKISDATDSIVRSEPAVCERWISETCVDVSLFMFVSKAVNMFISVPVIKWNNNSK